MKYAVANFLLFASVASLAPAATVRTTSGRTIEGPMQIHADGKITISPRTAGPVTLSLAEIARLDLAEHKPAAPTSEGGWSGKDVGKVTRPGMHTVTPMHISIADGGRELRGQQTSHDSFHFVYQRMTGDGEIVAKSIFYGLGERDTRSGNARAGVMIRESLDPAAPYAMVVRDAERNGVSLQVRRERDGETTTAASAERPVAGNVWLKLVRGGQRFTAYESSDGQVWRCIGSQSVPMSREEDAYIGLAVASNGSPGRSKFEVVRIQRSTAPPTTRPIDLPPRCIVTVGGSAIAGQARWTDGATMELNRPAGKITLASADVARVLYRPLSDAAAERLKSAGSGVLLASDDFVEGELREIDGNTIKLSSVIFGLKRFDCGREVAAVSLRPAGEAKCEYEVRLIDKSLIRAASVALATDNTGIVDAGGTRIVVPTKDVAVIRRK